MQFCTQIKIFSFASLMLKEGKYVKLAKQIFPLKIAKT